MTRHEDDHEPRKGSMRSFFNPMIGCVLLALVATACNLADTAPTSTPLPVFRTTTTVLPAGITATPLIMPTLSNLTPQAPFATAVPGDASGNAGGAAPQAPFVTAIPGGASGSTTDNSSLSAAGAPADTSASNSGGTCAQPSGWVTYTVQSGDNVSSLAAQMGISAAQLATANCLTNADVINVGQTIYVPSTPSGSQPVGSAPSVSITATTVVSGGTTGNTVNNPASNVSIQNLWVEPALVQNNGQYQVVSGSTVTFRVRGITNATKVAFVMQPIGSNASPITLGTDTNLSDGTSITWAVNTANLNANVWAIATDSSGATTQSQPIVVVTQR